MDDPGFEPGLLGQKHVALPLKQARLRYHGGPVMPPSYFSSNKPVKKIVWLWQKLSI